MRKKILSFVLSLALLLTMNVAPVHAQGTETFTVKVNDASAVAGENQVAVGIELENNSGIDGFSFCVEYDSDKLVYVDAEIDIADGYKVVSQQDESTVNLAWTGANTYTGNEQIATIYFNVPKDVIVGDAEIKIIYRDGYDSFYQSGILGETDVPVITQSGYVTIAALADSENLSVSVGNVSATATSNDIIVPISVTHNAGFSGFSFCVNYDTGRLDLESAEVLIADGYKVIGYPDGYGVHIAWTSATPYTANGDIAKLHFSLKDNVKSGKAIVTIDYRDGYDSFYVSHEGHEQDLSINTYSGYVDVNTHIFGEWETKTPATCISTGVKERKCSVCGKIESATLPKVAHEYDEVITQPTCTEEGYTTHTCKTCPDYYVDTYVNMVDHTPGKWMQSIAPECEVDGEEVQKCTVCDKIIDSKIVPATGHSFGDWYTTVVVQFHTDGEERRDCFVCDDFEIQVVPKLSESHTHGFTGTEEVLTPAKCEEEGKKKIYCSEIECGEYTIVAIDATGHTFDNWYVYSEASFHTDGEKRRECVNCDHYETERIPMRSEGHVCEFTGSEEIINHPSCTENGSRKVYCYDTDCGQYTVVNIDPTGHTSGDWEMKTSATCDADGEDVKKCTVCSAELEIRTVSATGHAWDMGITTKNPDCLNEGEKTFTCNKCDGTKKESIAAIGHTAGEWFVAVKATCTKAGTKELRCAVCNALMNSETIPATGHTLGEWYTYAEAKFHTDGEERKECANCDYYKAKRIPKLSENHSCNYNGTEEIISNPTCTTSGSKKVYCTETQCGKFITVDIDPIGHTEGEWETLKKDTCTEDGTEVIKCTVCNTQLQARPIEAKGHTWDNGAVTKPADCVNEGEKTFTCIKCNTPEVRVIPTGGHTVGEWVITNKPTCTEVGKREQRCTICNQLLFSETISSTGHSFGSWMVTLKPTVSAAGEKTRECSVCHTIESLPIEPTGVLPKIKLSSTSGSIGSIIKVTLSLQDNPGIITAKLKITYDSTKLQLLSVEDKGLLNDFMASDVLSSNPYVLTWDDALATANNVNNGDIAVLTFKILDTEAGNTTIDILYEEEEIYDISLNHVFFETENGQVEILDYIIGDVNNDGKVDIKDATFLRRYVAEWQNISINLLAADVNKDGKVNIKDATILRRYVAEWDGVEI